MPDRLSAAILADGCWNRASSQPIQYFGDIPTAFEPRREEWLAIPVYHIFGSEELSVLSRGIAELAPGPYLGLNAEDAQRIGMKGGQEIEFTLCGQTRRLPVRLLPGLPTGVAAIPWGCADWSPLRCPSGSK